MEVIVKGWITSPAGSDTGICPFFRQPTMATGQSPWCKEGAIIIPDLPIACTFLALWADYYDLIYESINGITVVVEARWRFHRRSLKNHKSALLRDRKYTSTYCKQDVMESAQRSAAELRRPDKSGKPSGENQPTKTARSCSTRRASVPAACWAVSLVQRCIACCFFLLPALWVWRHPISLPWKTSCMGRKIRRRQIQIKVFESLDNDIADGFLAWLCLLIAIETGWQCWLQLIRVGCFFGRIDIAVFHIDFTSPHAAVIVGDDALACLADAFQELEKWKWWCFSGTDVGVIRL